MLSKFIKNILGSKKARRVLFVAVFLLICYFSFSIGADCFAEGAVMDSQTRITNFNAMASEFIKCVYVLLWPLIFVCGVALDNSVIYGTWLHLDAPLWTFWNIMKNIANFALGGIVLFAILRNLLSALGKGGGDKWSPVNVIGKTLMAGILIQMSRFLVTVALDISTTLTYAVGGLPMTVLETNPNYYNRPVMSLSMNVGTDTNGMKYDIYYTYGDHKISDCLVKENLSMSGSYIVGPKTAYLWDANNNTGLYMDTGYCAVGGRPYRYNHILSGDDVGIYPDIYTFSNNSGSIRNTMYIDALNSNLDALTSENLTSSMDSCVVIPVDDLKLSTGCKEGHYGPLSFSGDDEFFRGSDDNHTILYTIRTLIEESKGFVGPLITIYSSLLDIQSFVEDNGTHYIETFISLLFKLIFFLALVAPLAGLAIVLIVRLGVLWVLIAASPVLILIWVFGDMLGSMKDLLGKTFTLGNIVQLIFAPVIITLAISLSLVFINAISGINTDGLQREEVLTALGMNPNYNKKNTYSILGLVEIELDTTLIGKGKDNFAYFITLLFATGIIWFFLVAALKMCGTVGDKVGTFMSDNFTQLLKNVPIIPLPGGYGNVGFEQFTSIPKRLTDKTIQNMKTISDEHMQASFPWLYSDSGVQTVAENVVENIKSDKIQSLTSAEVELLSPIFGTRNGDEIIRRVKTMEARESGSAKSLVNNFYTYKSENYATTAAKIATEGEKLTTHTNVDALKLTHTELNMAVQNDNAWKSRAEGMIGGAVHTSDGVYIVDVVPGTERTSPIYLISDRDAYEKAHFGDPIANVRKEDFDNWQTSDAQKFSDMNAYLTKMKASLDELEALNNNDKRSTDEDKQFENLNQFFTDQFTKKLGELKGDPETFTKPSKPEANPGTS